jgi:hypothetical protein
MGEALEPVRARIARGPPAAATVLHSIVGGRRRIKCGEEERNVKRNTRSVVAMATLGLTAGCGSGEKDKGGDKAATKPAQAQPGQTAPARPSAGKKEPAAVFKEFQTALADGDAAHACSLLSPSGTRQVEAASTGGSCKKWVEELNRSYDAGSKERLRKTTVRDVAVTGDKATIKYQAPILNIPGVVQLQRSNGVWRLSKLFEGV